MRKEIRRKLNKISALSLKTEIMEDLDGRALKQVYGLYLNNFADANVQLEKLTPEFFRNICRNMEGQAKYFITRRDGAMVAFNLCLIKNGACVDKFIGFDQRLRREFSLYLYTFCHNLDWCIKNGLRFYQMGQTDYQPKLRLGAKLTPLYVYARFTCNLLNPFGRLFARLIAPVNFDPALKRLKRQAGGPGF
jgi:predicted N-acyltransferase